MKNIIITITFCTRRDSLAIRDIPCILFDLPSTHRNRLINLLNIPFDPSRSVRLIPVILSTIYLFRRSGYIILFPRLFFLFYVS